MSQKKIKHNERRLGTGLLSQQGGASGESGLHGQTGAASQGRSGSGARVPAGPRSQCRGSSCSRAGGPGSKQGGARGQETVVPAPPGRWQPGRGWCRCRQGPWYRRAARTGSRRGPPRSSADTKPWFPLGSARGTRCPRPCPTRGTQRKVSLGPGGRSFQPLASPSGPPRVSFDPSTPRNPEPRPGKLLSLGPAPRKNKEPVQCSEAVSGAQAHKGLLCKKKNPHRSDIWGLNQECWSDQLPRDQRVLSPRIQLNDRPHP